METNILATAVALSDRDLLTRLDTLARTEREAVADLIVHLTALELRPSLYLGDGYGSLFDYCTRALRLSEDAACSRTKVVRTCLRFPVILDHLASGDLTMTSVRLLAPHLTAENHEAVLARARNKRREEVEVLVAELAPRPDVPATVRKLPNPQAAVSSPARPLWTEATGTLPMPLALTDPPGVADLLSPAVPATRTEASAEVSVPEMTSDREGAGQSLPAPLPTRRPDPRPVVRALAPRRYRVQFTIGQEAHDDLRAVQALLRREIPSGDPAAIFERALALLRSQVEKDKFGVGAKPRRAPGGRKARTYENRIRFRTDGHARDASEAPGAGEAQRAGELRGAAEPRHDSEERNESTATASRTPDDVSRDVGTVMRHERAPSRHISNAVKRAVWYRDRGQCAFVSPTGRRCTERNFLELHHIQPYAMEGPATAANIALRCRRHNKYEAELVFGPRTIPAVGPA